MVVFLSCGGGLGGPHTRPTRPGRPRSASHRNMLRRIEIQHRWAMNRRMTSRVGYAAPWRNATHDQAVSPPHPDSIRLPAEQLPRAAALPGEASCSSAQQC
jgi:hypothetical protein